MDIDEKQKSCCGKTFQVPPVEKMNAPALNAPAVAAPAPANKPNKGFFEGLADSVSNLFSGSSNAPVMPAAVGGRRHRRRTGKKRAASRRRHRSRRNRRA